MRRKRGLKTALQMLGHCYLAHWLKDSEVTVGSVGKWTVISW